MYDGNGVFAQNRTAIHQRMWVDEVYQSPPCRWLDERSPHVKAARKSVNADKSLCVVSVNLLSGWHCKRS